MTTITATAYELRLRIHEDSSLYWTPGAATPYWTRKPWYRDDVGVAGVSDFLAAEGFTDLEGFEDDDLFSIEVAAPLLADED